MFDSLSANHLIIIFSITIIISYFFNLYAKKSGIPAVLLLIGLGIFINYSLLIFGFNKPNLLPVLEVLGVVGLILILLEAALDLRILKEKVSVIIKSFFVALIGLAGTAFLAAYVLHLIIGADILVGLLYTIPLSILSSAIILPSIQDLSENKKEFMVYESTFSDIVGIVGFYTTLALLDSKNTTNIYSSIFSDLFVSIIFSVVISYLLIYVFQNIKGGVKLFLLIATLLLLYALGQIFELSSLIIILIFGILLNNYKTFYKGKLMSLLNEVKVEEMLDDMKVITAESAFVVRTFFFIIFGWSIALSSLFSFKVIGIGLLILAVIYLIRGGVLFIFKGKSFFPEVFLAPRGLLTILLFFAIPESHSIGENFQGVLLFVILGSCIVMTKSLVVYKNNLTKTDVLEEDRETTINNNNSV